MTVSVFKEFRLYCAHSVLAFGENHKCARKHGHTIRVRVCVLAEVSEHTGISVAFSDIEAAWDASVAHLDHTDLNDTFGDNPTAEVLALYIQQQMQKCLNLPCDVELKETETSGVIVKC